MSAAVAQSPTDTRRQASSRFDQLARGSSSALPLITLLTLRWSFLRFLLLSDLKQNSQYASTKTSWLIEPANPDIWFCVSCRLARTRPMEMLIVNVSMIMTSCELDAG